MFDQHEQITALLLEGVGWSEAKVTKVSSTTLTYLDTFGTQCVVWTSVIHGVKRGRTAAT